MCFTIAGYNHTFIFFLGYNGLSRNHQGVVVFAQAKCYVSKGSRHQFAGRTIDQRSNFQVTGADVDTLLGSNYGGVVYFIGVGHFEFYFHACANHRTVFFGNAKVEFDFIGSTNSRQQRSRSNDGTNAYVAQSDNPIKWCKYFGFANQRFLYFNISFQRVKQQACLIIIVLAYTTDFQQFGLTVINLLLNGKLGG